VVSFTFLPLDLREKMGSHFIRCCVGPRAGLDVSGDVLCPVLTEGTVTDLGVLPETLQLLDLSQNVIPVPFQVLLGTVTLGSPLSDLTRCLSEPFKLHQHNPTCYEMNQNA
jgi:hypothetical protein